MMIWRCLLVVTIWSAINSSAFSQDAGTVGMAAAYLHHCPSLRAGPRMINAAKQLYGQGSDILPDFQAGAVVQLDMMRDMTVSAICDEATGLFGKDGTLERSFVMPKDSNLPEISDVIVAGDNRLPGETDEVSITAAYVFHAVQVCPSAKIGVGFPFYLEITGSSIDDISKGGHRVPAVMRAYLQILQWKEWRQIVFTGDVDAEFCRIAFERYGDNGTAVPRMLKAK